MTLDQKYLRLTLETAIVAARLAGQHAMEKLQFLKVSVKNQTELVTQADTQCQQIIIDRIKETFPDHGFIAEEAKDANMFKQSPRGDEPLWWAIDPIDGTNNFAHGLLIFTVSIAAIYEGEPVVGVIFDPATDSMFTAVKGFESQLNNRRITTNSEEINRFSSIGLDSHFSSDDVPAWICEIIKRTRFRNLGSTALHLACVAKGSFIAAIHCQPKLWDIAAGSLIARTAGAVVTDHQGKDIFPVDLDNYSAQPMPIIAANKKTHSELLNLLKT